MHGHSPLRSGTSAYMEAGAHTSGVMVERRKLVTRGSPHNSPRRMAQVRRAMGLVFPAGTTARIVVVAVNGIGAVVVGDETMRVPPLLHPLPSFLLRLQPCLACPRTMEMRMVLHSAMRRSHCVHDSYSVNGRANKRYPV